MIDDPSRISPIFDPREDTRVALAMIRVFIEMHAPPGTLPARLYTGLRATEEAEALIEALRNAPCLTRKSGAGIVRRSGRSRSRTRQPTRKTCTLQPKSFAMCATGSRGPGLGIC